MVDNIGRLGLRLQRGKSELWKSFQYQGSETLG